MPPIIGQEDADTIFIFDLTLQEARDHFIQTKNYRDSLKYITSEELLQFDPKVTDINLPTLDEVFDLFGREVLVNVEVKTPRSESRRPMYRSNKLIEVLHGKFEESFNTNMFDKPI